MLVRVATDASCFQGTLTSCKIQLPAVHNTRSRMTAVTMSSAMTQSYKTWTCLLQYHVKRGHPKMQNRDVGVVARVCSND